MCQMPKVSMAICSMIYQPSRSAYFSSFRDAASSAAAPGCIIIIFIYFFYPRSEFPREFKNYEQLSNCEYDIQSAPSVVGSESCNKMALKRCTSTEMHWCRKLTSLDSPVLIEILQPVSFNRLLAQELRTPRVRLQSAQKDNGYQGLHISLPGVKRPPLLLHPPHGQPH